MLKQSQLESSQLWKDLEQAQNSIMDLQQVLEEALESNNTDDPAPELHKLKKQPVDDVRTSSRKFASLYNLWPPKDIEFYQQECPENPDHIGNVIVCYENETSESLGLLGELYSTFPEDKVSLIATADKHSRDMVCI